MKRKAFLTRMRNRRRGDQLELREPERRRAIDWRTLRVALPEPGADEVDEALSVGTVRLLANGVRLTPDQPCWVRGYRSWTDDDGVARAEFQFRPVESGSAPPPGAIALETDQAWQPE